MTAPERIWKCVTCSNVGMWHCAHPDECGNSHEYIRADLCRASTQAADAALERAAQVADAAMEEYAALAYDQSPVKVFTKDDVSLSPRTQNAAKCYAAGEIGAAIRALQSAPAPTALAAALAVPEVQALVDALRNISELNMTGEDENGHRWSHSDLIEQEIVAALAALAGKDGAT